MRVGLAMVDARFQVEHTSPYIGVHQNAVGEILGEQFVRARWTVLLHVSCFLFCLHNATFPILERSPVRIYDIVAQSLISNPYFIHLVCVVPKPVLVSPGSSEQRGMLEQNYTVPNRAFFFRGGLHYAMMKV